jgi:hypothetical protein
MPRIWRISIAIAGAVALAACGHHPPRCKGAYYPLNDASHYVRQLPGQKP